MKSILCTAVLVVLALRFVSCNIIEHYKDKGFKLKQGSPGVYFVFNGNSFVEQIISCQPYTDISGIWISVDSNQTIKDIELNPDIFHEPYLSKIDSAGYLKTWKGMPVFQASFHLPNAVTGATESSNIITIAVQQTLKAYLNKEIIGLNAYQRKKYLVSALVVLILSVCFVILDKKRRK